MLKRAIRSSYLEKRMQLSKETLEEYSFRIVSLFRSYRLPKAEFLLTYSPLIVRKEFDITSFDNIIRSKSSGLKVAWPRIDIARQSMEAHLVTENGLFAKNEYNILEPINGELLLPELVDIAFVPLVAFDKMGYRIGYGKGYYDRYLKRCRPGIPIIGVSFFEPVERIRDINEFDVPLTLCFTPSGIYEF